MSAVKDVAAVWNLVDAVDKNHAALGEALDDMAIMDDFVINEQRRAVQIEGALKAVDRHVHAGTKAAQDWPK